MYFKIATFFAFLGLAVASMPVVMQPMHHAPQPYKFGYDIKDKHGEQYRQEEGNGGNAVKGSYGFTDMRGVKRQVNYVADHAGFRAQVKTNEPGTANQNPAAVQMISNAPYAGGMSLGGLGYGGNGLMNAGLGYGSNGLMNAGLGYGGNGLMNAGLGYGGNGLMNAGLGYGSYGLNNGAYGPGMGYGGYGLGNGGYGSGGLGYGGNGLGLGILGGLGYARYGY